MTDGNGSNGNGTLGTLGHIVAWRVPATVSLDALRAGLTAPDLLSEVQS